MNQPGIHPYAFQVDAEEAIETGVQCYKCGRMLAGGDLAMMVKDQTPTGQHAECIEHHERPRTTTGEQLGGLAIIGHACATCGAGPIPATRTHCPRHTTPGEPRRAPRTRRTAASVVTGVTKCKQCGQEVCDARTQAEPCVYIYDRDACPRCGAGYEPEDFTPGPVQLAHAFLGQ